jgi:hypothetical protein
MPSIRWAVSASSANKGARSISARTASGASLRPLATPSTSWSDRSDSSPPSDALSGAAKPLSTNMSMPPLNSWRWAKRGVTPSSLRLSAKNGWSSAKPVTPTSPAGCSQICSKPLAR